MPDTPPRRGRRRIHPSQTAAVTAARQAQAARGDRRIDVRLTVEAQADLAAIRAAGGDRSDAATIVRVLHEAGGRHRTDPAGIAQARST